jgi:uncharacterized Zn finger protein (UPF0148 family)
VTEWHCRKCGSTEQRKDNTGCAQCNRRNAQNQRERIKRTGLTRNEHQQLRRLLQDDFTDITITPPMRAYLQAFTAYLTTGHAWEAAAAKQAALTHLENGKP